MLEHCLLKTNSKALLLPHLVENRGMTLGSVNVPCHIARLTGQMLKSNRVRVLLWSAKFRDHCQFEHDWGVLKRRMGAPPQSQNIINSLRHGMIFHTDFSPALHHFHVGMTPGCYCWQWWTAKYLILWLSLIRVMGGIPWMKLYCLLCFPERCTKYMKWINAPDSLNIIDTVCVFKLFFFYKIVTK